MFELPQKAYNIPLARRNSLDSSNTLSLIDQITLKSIVSILIFVGLIESGYIFVSLTTPNLITACSKSFAFEKSKDSQNIRMAIQNLKQENYFLLLKIRLTKKELDKRDVSVLMNASIKLQNEFRISLNETFSKKKFDFYFDQDHTTSHSVILINKKIIDFAQFLLSIDFSIDIDRFNGIQFQWYYMDPEAWDYIYLVFKLLTYCSTYLIICYFFIYKRITIYLLLLILTFLSTNPFNQITKMNNFRTTTFSFLSFIGFERLFMFSFFLSNISRIKIFFITLFFSCYTYVEYCSFITKFSDLSNSDINQFQIVVILFHLIYIMSTVTLALVRIYNLPSLQSLKFKFYAILASFSLINTIFTQIIFVIFRIYEKSFVPLISYVTTHVLIAYIIIYVHQPVEDDLNGPKLPYKSFQCLSEQ